MTNQPAKIRDEYISYVRLEKNYSFYTVSEYEKDVNSFLVFLEVEGISDLDDVTYPTARLYVTELYDKGLSRASISRNISSVRSFYKFANARYNISDNAFRSLHHPKKEERLPAFFYEQEMQVLFSACEGNDKKSLRDKALLEMLYATGIRVSELTNIKLRDIDDHLGIVMVMGKGRKERYVPFGSFAQTALDAYLENSRPVLLKQKEHDTFSLI